MPKSKEELIDDEDVKILQVQDLNVCKICRGLKSGLVDKSTSLGMGLLALWLSRRKKANKITDIVKKEEMFCYYIS